MKVSKTNKPAMPKTVKDLPAKNPQAVKGGIIIIGGATSKGIIDDGDYGSRIGVSDPNELSYRTR
jgi:hypothetical protein